MKAWLAKTTTTSSVDALDKLKTEQKLTPAGVNKNLAGKGALVSSDTHQDDEEDDQDEVESRPKKRSKTNGNQGGKAEQFMVIETDYAGRGQRLSKAQRADRVYIHEHGKTVIIYFVKNERE